MESKASPSSLQNVFDEFFDPNTSLAKIRDAALAGRLLPRSLAALEVAGRSLAWKVFLGSREPLDTELNVNLLLDSIRDLRKQYRELLLEKMKAPDGSYEEGFSVPGTSALPAPRKFDKTDLSRNNPLSLHVENPWKEWFAAVELRNTIRQDVERTFPDIHFFRNPQVQSQLTSILFLYSVAHPAIGYRQGMHELLAPLYYAVEYDSLDQTDSHPMGEIFSDVWVAADAWALFDAVMRGASRWYEWREPLPQGVGVSSTPLSSHFHIDVPNGPVEFKPFITPIIQDCNNIQSNLLRSVDPTLWKHMQSTGIEPQIYGIRWLRLLFTREFSMSDAMKLWDGLFATDPTFALAPWICVAMLIRIRNQLLPADYTGQLTLLLRYPSPTDTTTTHHTSLLLTQALALQLSPTPATGQSLMKENQSLLGTPLEVPDPPPLPQRLGTTSSKLPPRRVSGEHSRQPSSQAMGLPEMIARGLMEKGESLGINKTFLNAVSELRRNIPDLASSLVRSPGADNGAFPLIDERLSEERPPWEPRSRLEMEHEIETLKSVNKRLGDSLTWVVDVMLQDETQISDPGRLVKEKREALESLAYIRDVLVSGSQELEEDRLTSEEHRKRMREMERKKRLQNQQISPNIPEPKPASVPESHTTAARGRTRADDAVSLSPPITSPPLSNTSRLAPWSYTKSNFSPESSHLPATSLPRPPPPTSGDLRRPAVVASRSVIRPQVINPPAEREIIKDPLGALR